MTINPRLLGGLVVALFLVFLFLLWFNPWTGKTTLEKFWTPVAEGPHPVLLCVGREQKRSFFRGWTFLTRNAPYLRSHPHSSRYLMSPYARESGRGFAGVTQGLPHSG